MAPQGNNGIVNGPPISTPNSHIDDNKSVSNSASALLMNDDISLGSNIWIQCNHTPGKPQHNPPTPHWHSCDLNLPPQRIMDSTSQKTVSEFAPITPGKATGAEEKQASELHEDEGTNHGRDEEKNENCAAKVDSNGKEILNCATDPSLGGVSTPCEEYHNHAKGGNHSMDLNRTPEQKPRKKRHRPKVITEGKPKNTPKTVNLVPTGPKENPTGKRKYVRKKGLPKAMTTSPAETSTESDGIKILPVKKSCRRALNFDMEGPFIDESSTCKPTSKIDAESQAKEFCTEGIQSRSTLQVAEGVGVMVENTKAGSDYDLTHSVNQMVTDYMPLPEKQAPSTPLPTKPSSMRRGRKRKTDFTQENTEGKDQQTANDQLQSTVEMVLQTDSQSSPSPNDSNSNTSRILIKEGQAQGSKKTYPMVIEQADRTANIIGFHYNNLHSYQMMPWAHFPSIYKRKRTEKGQNSTSSSTSSSVTAATDAARLDTCPLNDAKEDPSASNANYWVSVTQSSARALPAMLGEAGRSPQDRLQNLEGTASLHQKERFTKKRTKGITRVRDFASLTGIAERKMHSTHHGRQAPIVCDQQQVGNLETPYTCIETLVADIGKTFSRKKRTKKANCLVTSMQQKIVLHNSRQFSVKLIGAPPEVIWKTMVVDSIVNQFKRLDINRESECIAYEEQNAIVPYSVGNREQNALVVYRRDGTIVPFEGSFDPVRKRHLRPKVDLDEESNRVWKLLLANINSEGIDGTDKEKEKWWEEDRRVFRGRADSFIARMHLVQGDRRFSQWKGSVVDSVVGVFLTQNVSDHLSSSAFMSLAACFPLKSQSNLKGCCDAESSSIVDKPLVCILDSKDTINWNENMSIQPISDQSSMTLHYTENNEELEVVNSNKSLKGSIGAFSSMIESEGKLLNYSTKDIAKAGSECFMGKERATNYMILSQNSLDTSVVQTTERTGSCSDSNSEEEDLTERSKCNSFSCHTSFMELLEMAGSNKLPQVHSHGNGKVSSDDNLNNELMQSQTMEVDYRRRQVHCLDGPKSSSEIYRFPSSNCCLHLTPTSGLLEVECFELFNDEARSSDISKTRDEMRMTEQSGLTADSLSQTSDENKLTVAVEEAPTSSSEKNKSCNSIPEEKIIVVHSPNGIPVEPKNLSVGNIHVTENTSVFNESNTTQQKTTESNLNEHGLFTKQLNEMKAALKAKGRRVGKEIKDNFDWDNLRRQVEANGRKRERTMETMDSLDWEAVRSADVNQIANTIKERGMNNILAERIKDFLNRMVREHGSIDLEWLRDIPPDKAKEYLLSIRGLGLKSVECVRLLTLHHLAFPVDTNVGRIAVRLGWVPLQPLPESLQLHLLELYPVLESIQKYLWPRLCKLDQRTLYELHYQMITFGKVFCTKSKPNCNACPMRGECRHFASAFASARLALPGPEEKRIVVAAESRTSDQNPAVIIEPPLALPQAMQQSEGNQQPEANQQLEAKYGVNNCEPIIEEPATPEPMCTQVSENDIEDTFYEDPDEIPTIKLNIEAFTQNLQNYMQENMEIQEVDMSRALVALTAAAASIPMPKLKNVSRLRTEHQVYELPDSHPLLDGLDKREPDDPCSYLLAIWTPGETPNSIQPPERVCSSQECGKLCFEKTCFSCNSIREANSQIVRGTILIPCRTAMRGSFPLNGTYFQVNEVFADHDSSLKPIDVPRHWLWNLPRRTVYFGTSIPTIFKGLTTEGIQHCFWRGFVCVRGFDQKSRAPRPLMARLHFPASKLTKTQGKTDAVEQ
ncbi:HhH-GPD domain-containing protein [Cephalotus follicularis]|uniref:HhH-GPD domain-containing protein n=1 Tax=Cephalotus follicularis TaxID=3775 RepID=A0A1Q3CZ23_CEPFO|nr:HhH-GPD domain-containing protein [Cephalotus follicularis]